MFSTARITQLFVVIFTAFILSACGGSSSVDSGKTLLTCDVPMVPDAAGTSCVAPQPIECPVPTVPDALNEKCVSGVDPNAPAPVVFPAEDEAILFYNRNAVGATNTPDDKSYEGYRVHNWNDETCDAYADESLANSWSDGVPYSGIDPTYGAYWIFKLKEGFSDCANFIIHIGTDDAGKALGPNNSKMPLMQDDATFARMNFTFDGRPDVYEFPVVSLGKQPLNISGAEAHWLDINSFVWDIGEAIKVVKLHHAPQANISVDDNDNVSGTVIELISSELTDEQKVFAPLVKDWSAFVGSWDGNQAKALAKQQLVLVGYNSEGKAIAATYVQTAKLLDALYTRADNDADEAQLGVVYQGDAIAVSVWAPTAQNVLVKVFDAGKNEVASHQMTENTETGVWSYQGSKTLNKQFYRFELTVYHHQNKAIETLQVTDPYSVGLSTNGEYSQFVNLTDPELMPEGWEQQVIPTVESFEDAVIYEGHVRDFSAQEQTVTAANRGKFLAFTELDSRPMQHLKTLADNGLTYFHVLPANDISSVNEDTEKLINLDNTVAELCAVKSDAPVCGVADGQATLKSVLESYSPFTNDAANLVNAMADYDSFNWGYDPEHFNVPDGSYSSNADGVARIKEMRAMVKSLHDVGLRVVLDVVYNHTSTAGLYENSVLDKIVPGYYHSRDTKTGQVIQSTCCNDTALEHRMMDKLMVDSLLVWAKHYGFDGFRFDIMSHGSKQQMLAAREAVRVVDPDTYFYGEGWGRDNRGFEHADQFNMAGTEISTFNDRQRDGIRNASLFAGKADDYAFQQQDIVKFGMAGTLADYVLKNHNGIDSQGRSFAPSMYAKDPADVVNYISKHDNETLWDKLQLELPKTLSLAERVRTQNLSQAIVLLSQGIPFLQLGGDFLRSKSLDRNTYNAGDWYNFVDYTMASNNWSVGLPIDKGGRNDQFLINLASSLDTKPSQNDITFSANVFNEFLKIRTSSKLFKLTTAQDIVARVGFHNIGKNQTQGLIAMSIDDGVGLDDLDPSYDAVVVLVNATSTEKSHTITTASGFSLHSIQASSVDSTVTGASFSAGDNEGSFTIPAYTVAVFVKNQGEQQGTGLSAYATAGAPDVVPYGDTSVFVRGDMNGWGEVDRLTYLGEGIYQAAIKLTPASYNFKLASGDWSTVNLGAPAGDTVVEEDVEKTLLPGSNDNLSVTIATEGTYLFTLDASDLSSPKLIVKNEEPFVGTTVFVRGGMNGWGETNPFIYMGEGKYQATFSVDAGSYEFKVASGDWNTVNMGAPEADAAVVIGEKHLLAVGGGNLSITFSETKEYTFVFDAANLSAPTITVFEAQMFGTTDVFIRGSMNGWGEVDKLSYHGNSRYSVSVDLTSGSYEFKVASGDWSTFNFGANQLGNNITLGKSYELVAGSQGNLALEIDEAGTYLFTVTGPQTVRITKSEP